MSDSAATGSGVEYLTPARHVLDRIDAAICALMKAGNTAALFDSRLEYMSDQALRFARDARKVTDELANP